MFVILQNNYQRHYSFLTLSQTNPLIVSQWLYRRYKAQVEELARTYLVSEAKVLLRGHLDDVKSIYLK
jgi:hypothetical protein